MDILEVKHKRKQEETTLKSLLLPVLRSVGSFMASNAISLLMTWVPSYFWKKEEGGGSLLCWYLMPILLICL